MASIQNDEHTFVTWGKEKFLISNNLSLVEVLASWLPKKRLFAKKERFMHDKNINSTAFFFIFIIQQTFALEFTLQVDIDGAIQLESFLR